MIDEPLFAPVEFDYCTTVCEALTYRPELRTLRWEIRKRELAVAYAKNGLLPELNLSALYRFLGLGNRFGSSDPGTLYPDAGSAALNGLYDGDYQELQVGLDFRMPVGYRTELSNVRNAQLKLAREIARLEDSELDVNKEIHETLQSMAASLRTATSHFNRWRSSRIEKDVFDELRAEGVETLDVALEAQRRLSQAEIAFFQSVTEYNKMLALLHRRKGTTLAYCGICFEEGPWPVKAYRDATEHSRRRSASRELNYGWSRPEVISRGQDYPSNTNIGRKTGETVPAGYIETYPGGVQTVPYNAPLEVAPGMPAGDMMIPSNVESIQPSLAPSVIVPPTSQTQKPKTEVQLVAYEESEPVSSDRMTLRAQSSNATKGNRKRLSAVPAKMDSGVSDAKRIPRGETRIESKEAPTQRAIPENPVRLNWSKVGADSRAKKVQSTSATIGRIVTRDSGDK